MSSKATRRRVVRRKVYKPPVLPERPKVTVGPRSYGLTKKGRHICIRFFVSRTTYTAKDERGGVSVFIRQGDRWFVIDMEEGDIAKGTAPRGYPDKKEAIETAREYRDNFGAWAVMPF